MLTGCHKEGTYATRYENLLRREERVSADERKHAKFRELAEKRTNKALEAIRLIGNLSNRQTYVYEEAEVRKIAKALRDAISDVEGRFGKASGRPGGEFKL
jgi:hypothetical protein